MAVNTHSENLYDKIHYELKRRQDKNLLRELPEFSGIDFCSNDYLGLSQNLELKEALKRGIDLYGAGSTASRLVRGNRPIIEDWEDEFAQFVGAKACLMVANGFTANLGLLESIADPRTIVYTDRLNHASILDGIRISGAKKVYYNHLDLDDLSASLEKNSRLFPGYRKIIVTETVFSMDGDIPDLRRILAIKEKEDAVLILDETHALGVFGICGGGVSCDPKYLPPEKLDQVDFRIYTMGKALGLEGGLIAMAVPTVKSYLINCMRSFVFSTFPLPCLAYAGSTALRLCRSMDVSREKVLGHSRKIIDYLVQKGFPRIKSESQILPVVYASEEQALDRALELRNHGLDVRAIRPPTVATPRLRISIHADHSIQDIEKLLAFL